MGKRTGPPRAPGDPHHSQGHASGSAFAFACGGVFAAAGSGMSFLSSLCGPSARCGRDARAPRHHRPQETSSLSLPGPCLVRGSWWLGHVVSVVALRAFGPLRAGRPRSQGDTIAPRRPPSLPGPCLVRGSWWLGHVVPVVALRASGPLRAGRPRSQAAPAPVFGGARKVGLDGIVLCIRALSREHFTAAQTPRGQIHRLHRIPAGHVDAVVGDFRIVLSDAMRFGVGPLRHSHARWDRARRCTVQTPVTQRLSCWKCGASLLEVPVPFARVAECPRCRADLHVCRMCELFDPGARRGCKEPVADEVSDRERANFCGYFTPVAGAGPGAEDGVAQAARTELDDLFGLPSSASASPSDADEVRSRLDELFGGRAKG